VESGVYSYYLAVILGSHLSSCYKLHVTSERVFDAMPKRLVELVIELNVREKNVIPDAIDFMCTSVNMLLFNMLRLLVLRVCFQAASRPFSAGFLESLRPTTSSHFG
jgi:hypothetical protein